MSFINPGIVPVAPVSGSGSSLIQTINTTIAATYGTPINASILRGRIIGGGGGAGGGRKGAVGTNRCGGGGGGPGGVVDFEFDLASLAAVVGIATISQLFFEFVPAAIALGGLGAALDNTDGSPGQNCNISSLRVRNSSGSIVKIIAQGIGGGGGGGGINATSTASGQGGTGAWSTTPGGLGRSSNGDTGPTTACGPSGGAGGGGLNAANALGFGGDCSPPAIGQFGILVAGATAANNALSHNIPMVPGGGGGGGGAAAVPAPLFYAGGDGYRGGGGGGGGGATNGAIAGKGGNGGGAYLQLRFYS